MTLPIRFIIIRSIARLTVFYGFLHYFFYSFEVRQYSINYVIITSSTTTTIIIIIFKIIMYKL